MSAAVKSQARTLNYEELNRHVGILTIRTFLGRRIVTKNYRVTAEGNDEYTVEHFTDQVEEGEPASYRVCIRQGAESCECKGYLYRRGPDFCRHVDGLKALRALGRI